MPLPDFETPPAGGGIATVGDRWWSSRSPSRTSASCFTRSSSTKTLVTAAASLSLQVTEVGEASSSHSAGKRISEAWVTTDSASPAGKASGGESACGGPSSSSSSSSGMSLLREFGVIMACTPRFPSRASVLRSGLCGVCIKESGSQGGSSAAEPLTLPATTTSTLRGALSSCSCSSSQAPWHSVPIACSCEATGF